MSGWVGVATPTLIYVGVEDRAEFDMIGVLVNDHGETKDGHVLTKAVEQGRVTVVFQHWLKRTR